MNQDRLKPRKDSPMKRWEAFVAFSVMLGIVSLIGGLFSMHLEIALVGSIVVIYGNFYDWLNKRAELAELRKRYVTLAQLLAKAENQVVGTAEIIYISDSELPSPRDYLFILVLRFHCTVSFPGKVPRDQAWRFVLTKRTIKEFNLCFSLADDITHRR